MGGRFENEPPARVISPGRLIFTNHIDILAFIGENSAFV